MLKADTQIFKLKDPRIDSLAHGKMTLRAFAYTITPGDWFIVVKDTVYALTEEEYYAAQEINEQTSLSKADFQAILQNDLDMLSEKDREEAESIKKGKASCSTCRYNAYKNQMLKIVLRYPAILSKYPIVQQKREIKDYPEITMKVDTKVSKIFDRFFKKTEYTRKACLDCVTKHVSMAYVKGCEVEQGYPEHIPLLLANLEEAYEECPRDCEHLRELLMFCIAKTKKDNVPFIPINNILYTIAMSREQTKVETANQENAPDHSFALELNDAMKEQLKEVPAVAKVEAMRNLAKIIDVEYSDDKLASVKYQGLMGELADILLPHTKDVSNLIRNRRIMFRSCPDLARNTEFDCKDILEAFKTDN